MDTLICMRDATSPTSPCSLNTRMAKINHMSCLQLVFLVICSFVVSIYALNSFTERFVLFKMIWHNLNPVHEEHISKTYIVLNSKDKQ